MYYIKQIPAGRVIPVSQDYRTMFKAVLEKSSNYIVLFDNVQDEYIFDYISGLPLSGKYLVTTKINYYKNSAGGWLEVQGMSNDEACELMYGDTPDIDRPPMEKISVLNKYFSGNPTSLKTVSAYLKETGEDLRGYLNEILNSENRVLSYDEDMNLSFSFKKTLKKFKEKSGTDENFKTAL
ncbi:MAG: hypothetical protein LUG24_07610 [Clostridiales bacterium]|nr:hypothetical protein [Clostridiales bacterium]